MIYLYNVILSYLKCNVQLSKIGMHLQYLQLQSRDEVASHVINYYKADYNIVKA